MSDLDVEDFKLFDAFNQQNFNINPVYVQITGDITCGYFFTQLCFLARYHNWDEFCICDPKLQEKYHLSEAELKSRRKKLIDLGLITVAKKGYPSKNHYFVNIAEVLRLIKQLDLKNVGRTARLKSTDKPQSGENHLTSQVKITSLVGLNSPDIPYNDQIINNNNAAVDLEVNELGNKLQVSDGAIEELSKQYDKKTILKQLKSLANKKRIINPVGWLKNALANNYEYSEKKPQNEPRLDLSPSSHQLWSESRYQQDLKARERLTDPNDWREKMLQEQLLKLSAC